MFPFLADDKRVKELGQPTEKCCLFFVRTFLYYFKRFLSSKISEVVHSAREVTACSMYVCIRD